MICPARFNKQRADALSLGIAEITENVPDVLARDVFGITLQVIPISQPLNLTAEEPGSVLNRLLACYRVCECADGMAITKVFAFRQVEL
jgi:hypothetical protein